MSASTEKKLRREAREAGIDKKAEAAKAEAAKRAKTNRRWGLVGIGVIVLVIVALALGSGLPYKSTAFTVGDEKFSAAEVNFHYGSQYNTFATQYGSYASIFGLDTSNGPVGLEDQPCYMNDGSWKDYFLDAAKNAMIQTVALSDYAAENGIALTEEEAAQVESYFDGLEQSAAAYGFNTVDQFFSANYGAGVNEKMVFDGYMSSALCSKVINEVSAGFTYTEDQLEEQYQSYKGEQDIYDYLYYFVAAEVEETEGEDGQTSTAVTEATLKDAKAKADEIVKAYKSAKGEDELAKLNSAIASVIADAEATEQRSSASSIIAAKEWLMDSARNKGDITSDVNTSESGYYITVFMDHNDNHYNMAQVRHILVKAVADENGEYTDEAKAAAKAEAEAILKEFESGDKSEESFAALAEAYSEDAGSNTNGGLYDTVAKGQMVEEFDAFCFEGHKKGDTAIVYGESASYAGYHVMYFVGEGQQYSDYIAEIDLRNADTSAWLEELMAQYETKEGSGMRLVD